MSVVMIKELDKIFSRATLDTSTPLIGLTRSLLAFGTLLVLTFNSTEVLFANAVGFDGPVCVGVTSFSLYCLFSGNMEVARYLSIIILIITISGWRPRYTCILHWWVTYSLNVSASILEGGDQVASVLSLLLIPVCIADGRKWHWRKGQGSLFLSSKMLLPFLASTSFFVIRLQVCYIYFNAAVAKFSSEEWLNGTAIYYFFLDPYLGAPEYLYPLLNLVVRNPIAAPLITWGSLLFELALAFGLVMPLFLRPLLLKMGIAFHLAIGLIFGIFPFAIAMCAALLIYLKPVDYEFRFELFGRRLAA